MEGFAIILKEIQNRIEEQKNDLNNMKINIIKSVNENINEKFAALDIQHKHLEDIMIEQQKQLNIQDKNNRKKNIILHGVQEEETSYHELENLVVGTLNSIDKYKFESHDIEYVRRLGRRTGNVRPILITFLTMGRKLHLLKNKKYFRDTAYNITEDFPPEVREQRKLLKEQLKEEEEKGNKCIIKYDRLIILNQKETENRKQTNKRNMSLSPEQIIISTNENSSGQKLNYKRKTKKTKTYSLGKEIENDKPTASTQSTLLSYVKKDQLSDTRPTPLPHNGLSPRGQ